MPPTQQPTQSCKSHNPKNPDSDELPYGTVNVVVAISALQLLSEYARTVCGPPV